MKCDRCSNYQPDMSGNNVYHYSACRSLARLSAGNNKLTNDRIQEIMDGKKDGSKWNYCPGFEKL